MSRVAAVVLAAGEGSRFGGAKQLLTLPDVLDRLAASGAVDEVVVVEGAHPLGDVVGRHASLAARNGRSGRGRRCGPDWQPSHDEVEAALGRARGWA